MSKYSLDKLIGHAFIVGLAWIAVNGAYNEHIEATRRKDDNVKIYGYFDPNMFYFDSDKSIDESSTPKPYSPFFEGR